MERLWSPWRLGYVTGADAATSCIFCAAVDDGTQAPLIVAHGKHCFVILNLYPYNSGHLMVVPRRHVATLAALDDGEASELMALTRLSEMALQEVYSPQGLNVGMNLGKPAGAGIADHLHLHLVPRWTGDTNFMSVVGNVRVLPEDVHQSADRLRPVFAQLMADGVR
jgi:ATP adenylyltransferase